jgi:hypothetical protein
MSILFVCTLFLGMLCRLYWFMAHPCIAYYSRLLGPTASTRFKPIGVAFGLIGGALIYRFVETLYYSLRSQHFVLDGACKEINLVGTLQPQRYQEGIV